jgi:hypothetical protein
LLVFFNKISQIDVDSGSTSNQCIGTDTKKGERVDLIEISTENLQHYKKTKGLRQATWEGEITSPTFAKLRVKASKVCIRL